MEMSRARYFGGHGIYYSSTALLKYGEHEAFGGYGLEIAPKVVPCPPKCYHLDPRAVVLKLISPSDPLTIGK